MYLDSNLDVTSLGFLYGAKTEPLCAVEGPGLLGCVSFL
jgi:hypothetical protein